jgi:hypothetical protein
VQFSKVAEIQRKKIKGPGWQNFEDSQHGINVYKDEK